jgi:hypothetical protein
MKRSDRRWTRGAIVLGIVTVTAGALVASPVIAAAPLTKAKVKKIVKKLAYTKKQADALFLDTTEGDGRYVRRLWAEVSDAGTLVRGSGATAASRPLTGSYLVRFDRDVTQCSYVASPHGAIGDEITASTLLNTLIGNDAVNVYTRNADGSGGVNVGFSLAVLC